MAGKVGFRVRTGWARPDAALLAEFGSASSAQVADSMSRIGAMDAGVKSIWPSPRIIGGALTVGCHSADNLMLHVALSIAQPRDIIVVSTQGNLTNAVFGELMATAAVKIGILALIVDGVVRDAGAIQALRLPVYARDLCPNSCNKDGPGEVGTAIACGGIAVHSGDVIIADRDGVTVVPLEDAAAVAKDAVACVQHEQDRLAEIEKGILVSPEIHATLRRFNICDGSK